MTRQYVTMAVYAFKKGLISEGELARYLRVDRLTAREQVEKHSERIHAEEEEFTHYTSDLGRRLTGS
jgi:predicted HTH domain antitoxin